MFRYGLLGLFLFLMNACDTSIKPDTDTITAGLSAEVREIFDGLYVGGNPPIFNGVQE
jgi:hypothetical protein